MKREVKEMLNGNGENRRPSGRRISGSAEFLSPPEIRLEIYGRRGIFTFDQPP